MSDSEDYSYSSLSSLDSEYDKDDDVSMAGPESDYENTAKEARGKKRKKSGGYIIKDALKAPRATTYTAQSLFDQIVSGDIDLDPQYQRDVVWPEAKQVGLIDSIFRNFYIPPVIFAVNAHEDGSESKICIDGKQRLTSIYRFMLGLIHHRDRASGERYWYKASAMPEVGKKKKRNILPDKYRRLFANKQIVCVEYSDINDRDEREIFQRVQLGMALTPAEKLGVVKTPRADFIRDIQSRFFKEEKHGLGSLDWDRSRGTDFRCLATILWCIDRYNQSPSNLVNTGSVIQLESFLNDTNSLPQKFRNQVIHTFEVFESMASDPDPEISGPFKMSSAEFAGLPGRSTKLNTKVSPIEFICICLLLLVWREKLSKKAMARAIRDMRRDVRKEHVDIRLNTKVGKTMIAFMKSIKAADYESPDDEEPTSKGKGKTANVKSPTKGKSKDKVEVKAGSKRKRAQEDEVMSDSSHSDDNDDSNPPITKLKSKSTKPRMGSTPTSISGTASPAPVPPSSTTTPKVPHTSLSAAIATANATTTSQGGEAKPTISKGRLATLRAMTSKQQHPSQSQSPSSAGEEG